MKINKDLKQVGIDQKNDLGDSKRIKTKSSIARQAYEKSEIVAIFIRIYFLRELTLDICYNFF